MEISKEESNVEGFEPIKTYTEKRIATVVKLCCENLSDLITPRPELKSMVYHILKAYYVDKKKYVIANCPTGSGKTIIGIVLYYCMQYLEKEAGVNTPRINPVDCFAYYLTSNKLLQDQIDGDIKKFELQNYLYLLKGPKNYVCIDADERFKNPIGTRDRSLQQKILTKYPKAQFASYEFRPCAGIASEKLQEKFSCAKDCPYRNARDEASNKSCTVLNYAYFLNVMKSIDDGNPNHFFVRRNLTICDEAHLIPDIVCDLFNYEFTQAMVRKAKDLITRLVNDFGMRECVDGSEAVVNKCLNFFYYPVTRVSEFITYLENLEEVKKILTDINTQYKSDAYTRIYSADVNDLKEQIVELCNCNKSLKDLFDNRPDDVYFESEEVERFTALNGVKIYKHILKDLKEAELVRTNMLSKINYGLFMSATLGDMDEYAKLMGMEEGEYTTMYLPSTFDFSKSPIYICDSGYLNFKSFDNNIDKVLSDALRICSKHPNEKGVIHTSTFKITNLLEQKVLSPAYFELGKRFLFYHTAQEKEQAMDVFKNSTIPYIFVGPSLYEGIDLPDDKCRFQILVKVPYAQMNNYIKKKITRYPFWYNRNCIEKIIQAVGRSNRHKNDYSTIYLLDSCFEKIVYQIPDKQLLERINYANINWL